MTQNMLLMPQNCFAIWSLPCSLHKQHKLCYFSVSGLLVTAGFAVLRLHPCLFPISHFLENGFPSNDKHRGSEHNLVSCFCWLITDFFDQKERIFNQQVLSHTLICCVAQHNIAKSTVRLQDKQEVLTERWQKPAKGQTSRKYLEVW